MSVKINLELMNKEKIKNDAAVALFNALGPNHLATIEAYENLAFAQLERGKFQDAQKNIRTAFNSLLQTTGNKLNSYSFQLLYTLWNTSLQLNDEITVTNIIEKYFDETESKAEELFSILEPIDDTTSKGKMGEIALLLTENYQNKEYYIIQIYEYFLSYKLIEKNGSRNDVYFVNYMKSYLHFRRLGIINADSLELIAEYLDSLDDCLSAAAIIFDILSDTDFDIEDDFSPEHFLNLFFSYYMKTPVEERPENDKRIMRIYKTYDKILKESGKNRKLRNFITAHFSGRVFFD